MKQLLIIFYYILFTVAIGKAQPANLIFPNKDRLPKKFRKAIKEQTSEYNRLFFRDSAITKHYTVDFMLDKIDNDSIYYYIFLSEYWIAFHYKTAIPELIKRITNKKEIGLINTADLIIWERVLSGQMPFYGKGLVRSNDLFTIAGRANNLLCTITGEYFGHVSMYSTQEELEKLQKKWIKWLYNL